VYVLPFDAEIKLLDRRILCSFNSNNYFSTSAALVELCAPQTGCPFCHPTNSVKAPNGY